MSTSIICGIDGSVDSQAALSLADHVSSRLGIRLVLAHVGELAHIPYAAAAPFGGSAGAAAHVAEAAVGRTAGAQRQRRVSAPAE
jgi:hypothetical protein